MEGEKLVDEFKRANIKDMTKSHSDKKTILEYEFMKGDFEVLLKFTFYNLGIIRIGEEERKHPIIDCRFEKRTIDEIKKDQEENIKVLKEKKEELKALEEKEKEKKSPLNIPVVDGVETEFVRKYYTVMNATIDNTNKEEIKRKKSFLKHQINNNIYYTEVFDKIIRDYNDIIKSKND